MNSRVLSIWFLHTSRTFPCHARTKARCRGHQTLIENSHEVSLHQQLHRDTRNDSFIDEKMTYCKLNTDERTAVLSLRYLTTKKNNQNHTEHFNPYTIQLTNPEKLTFPLQELWIKETWIQFFHFILCGKFYSD